MLLILSPSKTLDYETPYALKTYTQPAFLKEAVTLAKQLKRFSPAEIAALMEISEKLAQLNAARFKAFSTPFTPENARQALLAFKGDVYASMEVASYGKKEFEFAQAHLRILSGLYGLLRPLDLIQPYRLEMGRKLETARGKDLYQFWGKRLAEALNEELTTPANPLLINLASEEYGKAVNKKTLKFPMVNIVFKENQKGALKIIGLFAKQARGAMADYVIKHKLDRPEGLKEFSENGYRFEKKLSGKDSYLYIR